MQQIINLGVPAGPRLHDLSRESKVLLTAWLALLVAEVKAFDGNRFEFSADEVPMGYTRALSQLMPAFGIRFRFVSNSMRKARQVPVDATIPGCVGGGRRKARFKDSVQPSVRVRGRNGSFVPGGGEAVAAYNVGPWRDGAL